MVAASMVACRMGNLTVDELERIRVVIRKCGLPTRLETSKRKEEFWKAMSGDKKASFQSFNTVRGKKVVAEIVIPGEMVRHRLRATVDRMLDYWRMSAIGGVLSGTIGVQGHYANGLTALFIATGQGAGL